MLGIYFSGTGNSKYCLEMFLEQLENGAKAHSIEEEGIVDEIKAHEELIFSYPVQYSSIPKILRDFVVEHSALWSGKKVFVIATMGLFSGDGAGMLGRLLHKYGAVIVGGLHLKMPDSIGDEKALKRPIKENRALVAGAKEKLTQAAMDWENGAPPQEGIGFFYHMAGLFGQRLYFGHKVRNYTDKLKIDAEKCVGCGKCAGLCPMKNITMEGKTAVAGGRCTMCYRCVNCCPKQAITLLGKCVVEQSVLEKYL